MEGIRIVQNDYNSTAPQSTESRNGVWLLVNGETGIPNKAVDLTLRLLTIAHAGNAGHRGTEYMYKSLRNQFFWPDQRDVVR